MEISKEVKKLIKTSKLTGDIALIIIEDIKKMKEIICELEKHLAKASDYLKLMDLLEKAQPLYYLEEAEKLDNLIYEIVAEYKTGIISLMDRKNKTGLRTIKFNPNNNVIVLVLTREQIEVSDQLFKYIGPILIVK